MAFEDNNTLMSESRRNSGRENDEKALSYDNDKERGEDSTSTEQQQRQQQKPPDGGVKAWIVVLGGFCALFCTFGQLNSFGVFQSYYQQNLLSSYTQSSISWIGSVQVLLLFLGGIISGPLLDRFGVRAILIPASVILVFGIMMTSISTKYYQLILAQGIVEGLAFGLVFAPVVGVVGQYFTTRRAWALGIVASGASIGGVVFPIALNRLFNASSLGFGWSLRVIGFIMLALMLFSSVVMEENAPRRTKRIFLPEALKNGPYMLLNLSYFFVLLGLWAPIFFVIDYAKAQGLSTELAFYEVAILNAVSFFGRTIPGIVADKVGRFNTLIFMTLSTAILLFCWTAAKSPAGITVWIAVYGFPSGAVVSLYSPCVAQVCPKPSDIGTYIGMGLAMFSIAGLADGPINGALINRFGYLSASIFSAVMVIIGVICQIAARFAISSSPWAVA